MRGGRQEEERRIVDVRRIGGGRGRNGRAVSSDLCKDGRQATASTASGFAVGSKSVSMLPCACRQAKGELGLCL